MNIKKIERQLSDVHKRILLEHDFHYKASQGGFTRKIDSEHSESIYFHVCESEQSRFDLKIRFNSLFKEVKNTWNNIHGQSRKLQYYDFTLQEFSDEFKLNRATWHVELDQETLEVDASISSFINASIIPWFQSIPTIREARDWIESKGPIEFVDWREVIIIDYLLDDRQHFSCVMSKFKKVLESGDSRLFALFQKTYEPFRSFAPDFFTPVEIEGKGVEQLRKTLIELKSPDYLQPGDDCADGRNTSPDIYDVCVFLGSPNKGILDTLDGWRSLLHQISQVCPQIPTDVTLFSSTNNSGKKMRLDGSSDQLDEVSQLASSTISECGIVRVSSRESAASSPSVFLCCASETTSSSLTARFDPFVLLAIRDNTSSEPNNSIQKLASSISCAIEAKLSAHQRRPFLLPNIIGGFDSLIDSPIGIFRPGNRHKNEPSIDLLRGNWSSISEIYFQA